MPKLSKKEMKEYLINKGYKTTKLSFQTYACFPASMGIQDYKVSIEIFYKDQIPELSKYSGMHDIELKRKLTNYTVEEVFNNEIKNSLIQ